MSPETIRCLGKDGTMRLVLNRPEKHNAMNEQMIRELTDAARTIAADPGIRAVVLEAEGESFCAGGDLDWMKDQFAADDAARQVEARALFGMLDALDRLPQLVIGSIHGAALGGGVGLVSICDVALAGPRARFALTETRLGLIPATIAPFMMRRIGLAALRAHALHGTIFSAAEAQAMGLISECVEEAGMAEAVARHVSRVLACAPGAVAAAKALFRELSASTADEDCVVGALAARWRTDEARQGIAAFFAKEEPPWKR